MLTFQDIVQVHDKQQQTNYFGEQSFLSGDNTIQLHTSEVLRQVEVSDIPEGRWVGNDAWFGIIATAVEVYNKFKVHSTRFIKNNNFRFPVEVMYEIIKARKGTKPLGQWVLIRTAISDVPIFACAYPWGQRSIYYFLSTTRNNDPSL